MLSLGEANERGGDFPTLPLRQSEAALHRRHSQNAPRRAASSTKQSVSESLRKGEPEKKGAARTLKKSTTSAAFNATRTAIMADNEKLDNQRLKNFKNKGRDLEVKLVLVGVSV